jgi:hypothetical protein
VAGLVASLTGALPAPDLARIIAERSGGNPLLVTELARQLSRQGGDAAAARAAVPEPVRVITNARLAELSVPTRSVLKAAAVLGARFWRDVLGSVTGVPPGELADALATGRDARLLEPAGAGEDRFRHEMVRDAVYDAIPEADREELHAQAGGVLAAEYARRAGDRAMAALAFEDVAHWYEHVAAGLAARRAGHADQAAAALSLSATRLAAGGPDGGRAGFREAAERARRAGQTDLLARAALGLGGPGPGRRACRIRGPAARRRADQPARRGQVRARRGGWPADRGAQRPDRGARGADRAGHSPALDRLIAGRPGAQKARAGGRSGVPRPGRRRRRGSRPAGGPTRPRPGSCSSSRRGGTTRASSGTPGR